jgi:hypothetical protein
MEIVKALLIHLVLPAAGLQWFLWLRADMREEEIERPPVIPLFIIFATYGGLLLVILTALFWYWSGLASLGLAYLLFPAPLIMLVIAWRLYPERKLSRFHRAIFIASAAYIGIIACLVGGLFMFRQIFVAGGR